MAKVEDFLDDSTTRIFRRNVRLCDTPIPPTTKANDDRPSGRDRQLPTHNTAGAGMTAAPAVILRRPQVEAMTGLRRSTIYARIAEGRFPRPIELGGRAVGWIDSEITAWIAARISESRPSSVVTENS